MSEREGEKTNETSAECDELVAEYKEKVTLRVEKRIQKGIFCSLIAPTRRMNWRRENKTHASSSSSSSQKKKKKKKKNKQR